MHIKALVRPLQIWLQIQKCLEYRHADKRLRHDEIGDAAVGQGWRRHRKARQIIPVELEQLLHAARQATGKIIFDRVPGQRVAEDPGQQNARPQVEQLQTDRQAAQQRCEDQEHNSADAG